MFCPVFEEVSKYFLALISKQKIVCGKNKKVLRLYHLKKPGNQRLELECNET